jgi:translation initiation factor 2 beta subunit (eIF-2beta)/eIF-5
MFDLKEFLTRAVNARISDKMKGKNQHPESYFRLRNEIEDKVISETDFYTLFENVPLSEIENQTLDPKTLMLIVIEALKQYADNGEELYPKCLLLQNIYLSLKETLSSEIPNYPQEDGFIEYLKTKQHRIDLESARITGSICPFCESTDVKSFGANWKCRKCGREFRKHRKKEED